MRILMALAASLLLALALVVPVAAADAPGCSVFGATTAVLADDWHPFGQVVSGVAQGGPRGASWLVAYEHTLYCAAH